MSFNNRWVLVAGTVALVLLALGFFSSPVRAADYSVTFTEIGLPPGATWSVTITGVGTMFSSTSTIVFSSVAPDTYAYTISNATTSSCASLCMYHPAPASGSITVSASDLNEATAYTERFYMTVVGGSGGADGQGWYALGSSATVTSQGTWGRADGVGYRLTSYSIDGGSNAFVTTSSPVSLAIIMNSPHTVTYNKATQYQVTMDSATVTALSSITPPTIANDNYWYDSGTAVNLVLNGIWGRSSGAGFRVVSFSVNGVSTQVATTKLVTVLAIPSISSPESVSTSTTVQYQLTLDGGAASALSSIQSTPISGDNYWYDAGTVVQYVGQGIFDRLSGAGSRVTSWWLDSTSANTVSTAGAFTIPVTMLAPHAIHTTTVSQYEVSLTGTYAIYSITAPTLAGDDFWYDQGSSVTVVLNATFARNGGYGSRMTGISLNGGQATSVQTLGRVTALSLTGIVSPQTITVVSTTQVQVTLDSTSLEALSYITPPTIAGDNYWYDVGTPFKLLLNGVWDRAGGSGLRLSAYSIDRGTPIVVASNSTVTVIGEAAIESPQSVEASAKTQFYLEVNGGNSIIYSVAPQVDGDTGWYDAGTSLMVSSLGVYSRSGGVGMRVTSWDVDGVTGGPVTTTGRVSTPIITMTAPHVVDFDSVQQYEVILNSGAAQSLLSITPPTVSGDNYWYDSGASVAVVLSESMPTGSGSRYVLLSYSVDGGAQTTVVGTGSVDVLSITSLTSPQDVAATLATQFLLTISGGNGATPSKASPTGDGWYDNGTILTVSNPYVWGSLGCQSRQSLMSYNLDGSTVPIHRAGSGVYTTPKLDMTSPHSLALNSVTQYCVVFTFSDGSGVNQITPSSFQLNLERIGTVSYENETQWFDSGTSFTFAAVYWQGTDVESAPQQAAPIIVSKPLTVNEQTLVYAASIKVVDLFGLPVSGASAMITFANGTTALETSRQDGIVSLGLVPLGQFTAEVTNLGISTSLSGDASTQPQFRAVVVISFPLIVLLVAVVVIVAAALFLLRRPKKKETKAATSEGGGEGYPIWLPIENKANLAVAEE